MTDQQHPITPSPDLIRKWAQYQPSQAPEVLWLTIATQAANWGADMELDACCEWAAEQDRGFDLELRAARRPKPPSLAEEALKELTDWTDEKHGSGGEVFLCEGLSVVKIRSALERLQELEDNQ